MTLIRRVLGALALAVAVAVGGQAWASNNLIMTSPVYNTTTPKFGTAALNGGYGTTAATVGVTSGGSYTLEAWVKVTSSPSGNRAAAGNSANWGWFGVNSAGHAAASIGGSSAYLSFGTGGQTTTTNINDGNYHHLAISTNGTVAGSKFFVDGVAQASTSEVGTNIAQAAGTIVVGTDVTTPSNVFPGDVDEVAFWLVNEYTANFTPKTTSYVGTEGMADIYHLDSNGTDSQSLPAAMNYTLSSSASTGPVGVPVTLTFTTNGSLSTADNLTISDSVSGDNFSTTTPTLPATTSSFSTVSVTFTPNSTGSRTITVSDSQGLTALPSSGLTFTPVIFYQQSDYRPNGGPVSANPTAGGGFQGGYLDESGGYWSVTSANVAISGTTTGTGGDIGVLSRPSTEGYTDGQMSITFTPQNGDGLYAALRYNQQIGTSTTMYAIGVDTKSNSTSTYLAFDKIVSGTASSIKQGAAVTMTAGHSYTLSASVVGSTLTASLYDNTASALLASDYTTDTSVSAAGTLGAFEYVPTTSYPPAKISRLTTYTDTLSPATAYSLTGPPSGYTATASQNFTIVSNGSLPSSISVSLSDGGAGGTFSPSSVSLAANSTGTSSGMFTYTPSSTAGNITISSSASLSAPPSVTYQTSLTPVTVSVNSAAFRFSPRNWIGDSTSIGMIAQRGGSIYRQANGNGAYFFFTWNASSAPTATVLIPSTNTDAFVTLFVNGVATDAVAANGNINVSNIIPSASNTLQFVYRDSVSETNRWSTTGANVLKVTGVQLDGGSSAGVAPTVKGWYEIEGDSQSDGYDVCGSGCHNILGNWAFMVGQTLLAQGYDYSLNAWEGDGFIQYGDHGDVPSLYYVSGGVYYASQSRWNLLAPGVSALDSAGYISGYGLTNQQPLGVIIDMISNEALNNISLSDSQAAVTAWIGAYRIAAPNAKIIGIMPYSLQSGISVFPSGYVTALINGFAAKSATDTNVSLINLGTQLAKTLQLSGSIYLADGGYHFTPYGHGLIAGQISPLISQDLNPAKSEGFTNRFLH
jgi:hypothetical protein